MSAGVAVNDSVFSFGDCLVEGAEHFEVQGVACGSIAYFPAGPGGSFRNKERLEFLVVVVNVGVRRAGGVDEGVGNVGCGSTVRRVSVCRSPKYREVVFGDGELVLRVKCLSIPPSDMRALLERVKIVVKGDL